MRIRPGGAELLDAARGTLAHRIVPHLPPDCLERMAGIERAMALGEERLTHDMPATDFELNALEAARAAMRDTILHALPPERRYDARLVAKAIAVATAELANGNAGEMREVRDLAMLLGAEAPAVDTPDALRCSVATSNARLSARIRSGDADPGEDAHDATLAHLRAMTLQALSESNPTYHRLKPEVAAPARAVQTVSHGNAAVAAWSDVSRSWFAQVTSPWRPMPAAKRFDSWYHFGGTVGEAVCVSTTAAIATQADVLGYVAQRVAANPRVPMFAVESAHQIHDVSVAFADASAALCALVMAPFRNLSKLEGSRTR